MERRERVEQRRLMDPIRATAPAPQRALPRAQQRRGHKRVAPNPLVLIPISTLVHKPANLPLPRLAPNPLDNIPINTLVQRRPKLIHPINTPRILHDEVIIGSSQCKRRCSGGGLAASPWFRLNLRPGTVSEIYGCKHL